MDDKTRDRLNHIESEINKEVKERKKTIETLQDFSTQIRKLLWEEKSFKCPFEKSNYDALCPECNFALPKIGRGSKGIGKHTLSFTWPHNMPEVFQDESRREGCDEWERKYHTDACGCGGTEWCICGYNREYCCHSHSGKCPYCDRDLKDWEDPKYLIKPSFLNIDTEKI